MPGVNLPRNFNAEEYKKSSRKFSNMLPTREACDLNDPKEMFLWMFVAQPGMNGGQQAMPAAYNMLLSEHLFECGAMLRCENCGHAKDPEKVYVPPAANDPHWMTSPGKWKPKSEVPQDKANPMDAALDGLTNQQQAALFQRLLKKHQDGVL
jgi:hypothetical protein